MGSLQQKLIDKLQTFFSPIALEVQNESENHKARKGSESHFQILIASEKFVGLTRLERHKMVYGCLADEMKTIHMLALKTLTPEEWRTFERGSFTSPKHQ